MSMHTIQITGGPTASMMSLEHPEAIINPRRMREGYCSRRVCVCECVCVSVAALAATYLIYTLKTRCH